MNTLARLLVLVVILNVIRYLVGGPIESVTIMEPMHAVMPEYPEVFDTAFSTRDFVVSLGYNYVMWFAVTLGFHFMHPQLRGSMMLRSLKAHAVMWLFFVSLAAVYMNHYVDAVKSFYAWSMVDAVITFSVVAVSSGLLYPRFFPAAPQDVDPAATGR